jgi:hypothetical protein
MLQHTKVFANLTKNYAWVFRQVKLVKIRHILQVPSQNFLVNWVFVNANTNELKRLKTGRNQAESGIK